MAEDVPMKDSDSLVAAGVTGPAAKKREVEFEEKGPEAQKARLLSDESVSRIDAFINALGQDPLGPGKRGQRAKELDGATVIKSRSQELADVKKKKHSILDDYPDGYKEFKFTHALRAIPIYLALNAFKKGGLEGATNVAHFGENSTMKVVFSGTAVEPYLDDMSIYGTVAYHATIASLFTWYQQNVGAGDTPLRMYFTSEHSYTFERSYTVLVSKQDYSADERYVSVPQEPAAAGVIPHLIEYHPTNSTLSFRPNIHDWPLTKDGKNCDSSYSFLNLAFDLADAMMPDSLFQVQFVNKVKGEHAFPQDNGVTAEQSLLACLAGAGMLGYQLPQLLSWAFQHHMKPMRGLIESHIQARIEAGQEDFQKDSVQTRRLYALQAYLGLNAIYKATQTSAVQTSLMTVLGRLKYKPHSRRDLLGQGSKKGKHRENWTWDTDFKPLFEEWQSMTDHKSEDGWEEFASDVDRLSDLDWHTFDELKPVFRRYCWLASIAGSSPAARKAWQKLLTLLP